MKNQPENNCAGCLDYLAERVETRERVLGRLLADRELARLFRNDQARALKALKLAETWEDISWIERVLEEVHKAPGHVRLQISSVLASVDKVIEAPPVPFTARSNGW